MNRRVGVIFEWVQPVDVAVAYHLDLDQAQPRSLVHEGIFPHGMFLLLLCGLRFRRGVALTGRFWASRGVEHLHQMTTFVDCANGYDE